MTNWDDDSSQLHSNLELLLEDLRRDARSRSVPTAAMARGWHERTMRGLTPPAPQYVGRFRGEEGLQTLAVRVGGRLGVPPGQVAAALEAFERTLQSAVGVLDERIRPDAKLSADQLAAIIELCAWAHSEWVRIHPFANGNGRTARLWANFIAMRYGVPPFVRLRPRPAGDYGAAARDAMDGRWQSTARVFASMYREVIRE